MIFITLNKFKEKPTKENISASRKLFEKAEKEGVKVLSAYYTIGQYDSLVISEAPDEKIHMKAILRWQGMLSTETLVAVPMDQAGELVE